MKEKISENSEIDEYIISKGKVDGKKNIKVLYPKSDSNSFHSGFPFEADFEIVEDELIQAKKVKLR